VILPLDWAIAATSWPRSPSDARLFALKGRHAGVGDEILLPQLAHAFELVVDQGDLALLGGDLVLHAHDLLTQLRNALAQLRLLPAARLPPQLEESRLLAHQSTNVGGGLPLDQLFRKAHPLASILLRFEASLARDELIHVLDDHCQIGARDRLVEAQQEIARLHFGAVADPQLANDTTRRVLHLLNVVVDDEEARSDDGAGQLRGNGPSAHPEGEEAGHGTSAE